MAKRKKKGWGVLKGVPYGLAMIAGGAIVVWVNELQSPWHLAIPWGLTALFFICWRLAARKKVVEIKGENDNKPRVKRLV